MDINTANHIIGKFGINHNTDTFWETIELLDNYMHDNLLTTEQETAYRTVINELSAYYDGE